jgi:hypothetical protein
MLERQKHLEDWLHKIKNSNDGVNKLIDAIQKQKKDKKIDLKNFKKFLLILIIKKIVIIIGEKEQIIVCDWEWRNLSRW